MTTPSPSDRPPSDGPDRPATDRLILLGRIAGAHGLRGDVLVRTFSETPDGIAAYGPLSDRDGGRQFRLKVVRVTAKGVIARVDGVGDRTAAEALRGVELYVPRARLPAPDPNAYYYEDLVGLAVATADGHAIGRVVGVVNYGAGDLLEVRLTGCKTTELVPFADPFVGAVDVAGGRVVIDMARVSPPRDADEDIIAADALAGDVTAEEASAIEPDLDDTDAASADGGTPSRDADPSADGGPRSARKKRRRGGR